MAHSPPLVIDLFTGLHGWSEGFLLEGWRVVGFDIEDMCGKFDVARPNGDFQLVLQDVLTIDGAQFKDASLIVASPPCQKYSYMGMPWSKAKAIEADYLSGARDTKELNALFDACFRIQREACAAAGRHIPMIVENVRGAQKWVGRSNWNYGSFHLWGDVPALMPMTASRPVMKQGITHRADGSTNFHGTKVGGLDWSAHTDPDYKTSGKAGCFTDSAIKNNGGSWFGVAHNTTSGKNLNPVTALLDASKGGDWFNADVPSISRRCSGKSKARKFASVLIAKIPLPLSRYIAATYKPLDCQP